jgi:hypothetical protein
MVYSEWPLGNGLEEARTLARKAEQARVRTVIGLQAGFAPQVRYARAVTPLPVPDAYDGNVTRELTGPAHNVAQTYAALAVDLAQDTYLVPGFAHALRHHTPSTPSGRLPRRGPDPAGGAYAQWVVLPAHQVVKAPAGLSHAETSTLPMNGLTARPVLDEPALGPGWRLAVTGAAGAVGGYVEALNSCVFFRGVGGALHGVLDAMHESRPSQPGTGSADGIRGRSRSCRPCG